MNTYYLFEDFVASELKELESRDVDTLYICISETLEAGLDRKLTDDESDDLYVIIENQLKVGAK